MLNAITFVDAMEPCHSLENRKDMSHPKVGEIKIPRKHSRNVSSQKREEKFEPKEEQIRFLIVCEGEETERNYFNAIIDKIPTVRNGSEVKGVGMNTVSLVNRALEIKEDLEQKNDMTFDQVWVVFDKDNFESFNKAIEMANTHGIQSAWTNESFELWFYLHFDYLDTGISRSQYIEKLEKKISTKKGEKFKYEKEDPRIYELLQKYGNENLAIRYAQQLRESYEDTNYAKHNPCTMVDKLVEKLNSFKQHKEL